MEKRSIVLPIILMEVERAEILIVVFNFLPIHRDKIESRELRA